MTEERRSKTLTKEDLDAIVEALRAANHQLDCRFGDITPEEMRSAIRFCNNANLVIEDSKSTIRKALLNLMVAAILGLLVVGAGVKIYNNMPKG